MWVSSHKLEASWTHYVPCKKPHESNLQPRGGIRGRVPPERQSQQLRGSARRDTGVGNDVAVLRRHHVTISERVVDHGVEFTVRDDYHLVLIVVADSDG